MNSLLWFRPPKTIVVTSVASDAANSRRPSFFRPYILLRLTSSEGRRNIRAAALMLIAPWLWSVIPAMVGSTSTNGAADPFAFNAGWRIGGIIGCLLWLVVRYPRLSWDWVTNQNPHVRRYLKDSLSLRFRNIQLSNSNFGGWMVVYAVAGKFEYVLFVVALGLAHNSAETISAVIIVFAAWPIIFIVSMAVLFKGNDKYRHQGGWLALMILFCFIGLAFVSWPEQLFDRGKEFYIPVGIALLAAIMAGSHHAVSFKWADILGSRLGDIQRYSSRYNEYRLLAGPEVVASMIAMSISALLSFGVVLILGENVNYKLFLIFIIGGFVFGSIADGAFRGANVIGANLGANAIIHATPIFSLVWFAPIEKLMGNISLPEDVNEYMSDYSLASELDEYFVIGVLIITVSNLLINSQAEIRRGFNGLLLTLGLCGTFVYFRDYLFASIGLDQWEQGLGEYFSVVGIAATVFTLLLAFRVSRLVARTDAEENRVFITFRKLQFLAIQARVIDEAVLDCVLRIKAPQNPEDLQGAYTQAREHFRNADYSDASNREMLIESEADLDALVRSKRSAVVLGELFSLVIFGGITIFLALFARPTGNGDWSLYMFDIFAMLISPVIIFLMVNIWDLHQERAEKWLEFGEESRDYAVRFPSDIVFRRADQWLSIIIGVAIVATYVGLLGHKHMGWFSAMQESALMVSL